MIRPSTRRDVNAAMSSRSRFSSSSELPAKTSTPRVTATSSIERWRAEEKGLATSSSTTPTLALRPFVRRRLLAVRLWRYPTRSTAAVTRSLSLRVTPGSPLTTRETVLMLTLAAAATSRMVGRSRFCIAAGFFFVNVVKDRAKAAAEMAARSHLAFSSSPCYILTTLSLTTLSGNTGRPWAAVSSCSKGVTLNDRQEPSNPGPRRGHGDPRARHRPGGRCMCRRWWRRGWYDQGHAGGQGRDDARSSDLGPGGGGRPGGQQLQRQRNLLARTSRLGRAAGPAGHGGQHVRRALVRPELECSAEHAGMEGRRDLLREPSQVGRRAGCRQRRIH